MLVTRSMLAGASGQTLQRPPKGRPEPRLQFGDAELERADLNVDAYEIHLPDGGTLDCVRCVIDDGRHRERRRIVDCQHIPNPGVHDEGPVRKAGSELVLGQSRHWAGESERLYRIPGSQRHTAPAERPILVVDDHCLGRPVDRP